MTTTTLLHLSDLHFGDPDAARRASVLLAAIAAVAPDVVAVSGDLTRRARTREFAEARAFLDRIAAPTVVVPGNHDVPLWNLLARIATPLEKYRRIVTDDLAPTYVDEVVAVLGVDTTRSFTVKGGRLDDDDLEGVARRLETVPAGVCRVVVGHHPLATPPERTGVAAGGGRRALERFARLGVDAVLSGHHHESHVATTADFLPHLERGVLLVAAGTSSSPRGRGSERGRNAFNVLHVSPERLGVTTYVCGDDARPFCAGEARWFRRHPFSPGSRLPA